MRCFSAAQQQQHSSSSTAAVVAATSSCCFGPSTPGQTRTPNEENGTPKRDFFSGLCILQVCIACGSALRIVPRDASRIVEQQKQQHSSSSTAAVVAATSRLRTKRTSVDAPVSLLFRSCAFAQFEKDERGHTAKSLVNHCCFTVPLNTLRLHTR